MRINIPKDMIDENSVIAVMKCPKCKEVTVKPISFDDSYFKKKKRDDFELHIHSCVSGGIYKVYFECPECREEIDVML